MRSYQAARGMFNLVEFGCWIMILAGVFLALSGGPLVSLVFRTSPSAVTLIAGALPGFALAMFGFYGLIFVQMSRASVDSAEYAQQALKVSRDQLEISRQKLAKSNSATVSYKEVNTTSSSTKAVATDPEEAPTAGYAARQASRAGSGEHQPDDRIDYNGHRIRVVQDGFVVAGLLYDTLDLAKAVIDGKSAPNNDVSYSKSETSHPNALPEPKVETTVEEMLATEDHKVPLPAENGRDHDEDDEPWTLQLRRT